MAIVSSVTMNSWIFPLHMCLCVETVLFLLLLCYTIQNNPSAMSSYAIKMDTCSNNISQWAHKTRELTKLSEKVFSMKLKESINFVFYYLKINRFNIKRYWQVKLLTWNVTIRTEFAREFQFKEAWMILFT